MFKEKVYLAVIILFAGFFVFFKLGDNYLIEFDEGVYGLVAKNILRTGDWFTLNWRLGIPWFDKGPLYLWLTAISLKVFGLTSFAVRFWSALLGWLGCLVVYYLGRELYNPKVGFMAALILASTTGYLYYARNGMLDVPNATFNSLSVLFLIKSLKEKKYGYGAALVLALAFLNRGPLALIGLVSFFLYLGITKRLSGYSLKELGLSLGIFLAVNLPWHLMETLRHGWNFWEVYLGHQVFLRFSQTIEGKGAPLLWYVTVIRTHFRIWFIVLLPALVFSLAGLFKRNNQNLLVLVWSVLTFLIFTLAQSKLIWYIMPIYPPLALMTANFLFQVSRLVRRETFLPWLVLLVAIFYNIRVWPKVQPTNFTHDQVRLIESKNLADPGSKLLYVGHSNSVVAFYSQAEVNSVPIEELPSFLTNREFKYALLSQGDFDSLVEKEKYEISQALGDWLLISKP